jgi:hypothetical protein
MHEVSVLEFRGKSVVKIDVSGSQNADEIIATFAKARDVITSSPERSVRALTNVTNCHFSKSIVDSLVDLARHASPHLLASAGVGVTGLKEIVARGFFTLIGRKVELFPTEEKALDWLARQ